MAILGVDDFKAKLRGGGARPNLFQVTINYPGYANGDAELTSFMVSAASLPSSAMGEIIVPFRGRQLKMAGDRTFDQWTTTIINDTDFMVRNALERWMNGINDLETNTGLVNVSDYTADLRVEQLDRADNILKRYIIRNCWPTILAPVELSYDTVSDIETFDVTWRYTSFTASDI